MSHLIVENLSKSFGGVQAVSGVSLEVKEREIIGVIGPNGAGKSTLFNLITGVYTPDTGSIKLGGKELVGCEQHEITRAGLGRTFQNIRLFQGLNVLENVMTAMDPLPSYNLLDVGFFTSRKKRREREVAEQCMEYLKIVGLDHLAEEKPGNLPYGLQRKLEIARALATQPKVLLLDEPAAGLNPSEVQEFIELVKELQHLYNFSVIVIEHRMEVIMTLSKHIYVLTFGKLLAEGSPLEIQCNAAVMEAYLGEGDDGCSI